MEQATLIAAENHWALWAVLLLAAAFGLWAERTRWGARISGAVIAILATFVLSNLRIIPSSAPAFDAVWSYLVPLAIPLLLFQADLRRILREAGPTLIAFGFGAVGTVLGTLLAFRLIPLGEEGWKLAGIFCATYVGGSLNFVAVSEALGLEDPDLIAAGVGADNLIMTVYFLVLFALPSIGFMRRRYARGERPAADDGPDALRDEAPLDVLNLSAALSVSFLVCAAGFGAERFIRIQGGGILILTALTVILATLFPKAMARLRDADKLGMLLMQVFFAAIGASANILVVVRVGAILFLFAAVILFVHLAFLLTAARICRLRLEEIVIASNANMGGPTTAAAMAAARGWNHLVIPAILCGTLGYATATFVGVAVGLWVK